MVTPHGKLPGPLLNAHGIYLPGAAGPDPCAQPAPETKGDQNGISSTAIAATGSGSAGGS
jgi:hypothetical protein